MTSRKQKKKKKPKQSIYICWWRYAQREQKTEISVRLSGFLINNQPQKKNEIVFLKNPLAPTNEKRKKKKLYISKDNNSIQPISYTRCWPLNINLKHLIIKFPYNTSNNIIIIPAESLYSLLFNFPSKGIEKKKWPSLFQTMKNFFFVNIITWLNTCAHVPATGKINC